MKRKSIALLAAAAVLSLPACGEVDEDPAEPTDEITDTTAELTLPEETDVTEPETDDTGDITETTDMDDTDDMTDTTGGMDDTTTTTSG